MPPSSVLIWNASRSMTSHVVILQIDRLLRVGDDGLRIADEEILAFA